MDRIEAMRVFVRVAERRSFTQAAEDLLMSRSRVSDTVRWLEERLTAQLLTRTTRHVVLTPEGEAYHRRCVAILADIDDAEAALSDRDPKGPLRVDVSGDFARHFLVEGLPDFLGRYPGIRLHLDEGERLVDLVREGVDCVIRIGHPADSGLVGRRLAMLDWCTVAAPAYLRARGTPKTPDALEGHCMVGFVSSVTGNIVPLDFQVGAELRSVLLPAAVTVSSAAMNVALALQGLGLVQVPRFHHAERLAAGTLVEVLPDYAPPPDPVSILYPEGRQRSARLRVFIDWVVARLAGNPMNRRAGPPASPEGG